MEPWTAYFLGVASALVLLPALWLVLRIADPWVMARAANLPIGFFHIVGMRMRQTDPRVVVGALAVMTKSDQPISPLWLEAIYMTLPDRDRDVDALVRAARDNLTATAPQYGVTPEAR